MKKIIFALLVSFSLVSCSRDMEVSPKSPTGSNPSTVTSKLAAGSNVKLYLAWSSYNSKYGRTEYFRRFQVEVRNIAYEKKVFISHKMDDGSWKDFPLSYISSTVDNSEIWGANISLYTYKDPAPYFGDEFVVRYEVNGTKYYDNNNYQNYKMGNLEGTFLRTDLNVAVDTYFTNFYSYYNSLSIHVDVRNISYQKQVSIVYTTDNWATSKTAQLGFLPSLTVGEGQYITSPNRFGMERWYSSISMDPSVSKIEYAVVYKVNGTQYWDNNFGKNYIVYKK
jgi:hypothetical protein